VIVAICFVLSYRAPKHSEEDLTVPGILVDLDDSVDRYVYYSNRADRASIRTNVSLIAVVKGTVVNGSAATVAVEGAEDARRARGLDPTADALLDRQAALLERGAAVLSETRPGRAEREDAERLLEEYAALARDFEQWMATVGHPRFGLFKKNSDRKEPGA
jgi:hypothetical protein